MFVSNSYNLGATLDLKLLTYFAQSGAPFLMEVAERTAADSKGGHLARRGKTGGFVLRESAQCPKEDAASFENIEKHKFFNTNNVSNGSDGGNGSNGSTSKSRKPRSLTPHPQPPRTPRAAAVGGLGGAECDVQEAQRGAAAAGDEK